MTLHIAFGRNLQSPHIGDYIGYSYLWYQYLFLKLPSKMTCLFSSHHFIKRCLVVGSNPELAWYRWELLPDVSIEADGVEVQNLRRHELRGAADHLQLRVRIQDLSGQPEVDDFDLEI